MIMEADLMESFNNLGSTDDKIRFDALQHILKITEGKVNWVYEVWDDLVNRLDDENSYQRSISIMVLCNLAKSDTQDRLASSLDRLLAHTRDDKFITSRQCIQNIWKVALLGDQTRERVISHLETRFEECSLEKHYNLIRQDILQSMRLLYDSEKDAGLLLKAKDLVLKEKEEKYRKKYELILKVN
jgi:hypothetical protein